MNMHVQYMTELCHFVLLTSVCAAIIKVTLLPPPSDLFTRICVGFWQKLIQSKPGIEKDVKCLRIVSRLSTFITRRLPVTHVIVFVGVCGCNYRNWHASKFFTCQLLAVRWNLCKISRSLFCERRGFPQGQGSPCYQYLWCPFRFKYSTCNKYQTRIVSWPVSRVSRSEQRESTCSQNVYRLLICLSKLFCRFASRVDSTLVCKNSLFRNGATGTTLLQFKPHRAYFRIVSVLNYPLNVSA